MYEAKLGHDTSPYPSHTHCATETSHLREKICAKVLDLGVMRYHITTRDPRHYCLRRNRRLRTPHVFLAEEKLPALRTKKSKRLFHLPCKTYPISRGLALRFNHESAIAHRILCPRYGGKAAPVTPTRSWSEMLYVKKYCLANARKRILSIDYSALRPPFQEWQITQFLKGNSTSTLRKTRCVELLCHFYNLPMAGSPVEVGDVDSIHVDDRDVGERR